MSMEQIGIAVLTCITILGGFAFWSLFKPDWIDRNSDKILFSFLLVFAIQGGLACWRLPKEYRSDIMPKLKEQIKKYDELSPAVSGLEIGLYELTERFLKENRLLKKRIRLHHGIEIQKVKVEK